MLYRLVMELGPWSWWLLGLVLLAAELLMPGVFLVWIGIAALCLGMLSLLLWDAGFWLWQVQLLLFAVLSIGIVIPARRFLARDSLRTDEPLLNQRGASLVGRTATLLEPIREGRGRIRLDDTFWSVMGPDLATGTQVRIVSSTGRDLVVEAV